MKFIGIAGWFLLVLATILAQWILRGTRVIEYFATLRYANHLLQGTFCWNALRVVVTALASPACTGQVDDGSPDSCEECVAERDREHRSPSRRVPGAP